MKFSDFRKWQIGDLWLNHGYSRKELGDAFQFNPNQFSEIARWNVKKGYFTEEERLYRIRESKAEGGKISHYVRKENLANVIENPYANVNEIYDGGKLDLTYNEKRELRYIRSGGYKNN